MARILVLGSSFAGLTAALELRKKLDTHHQITVASRSERFVFLPSLIWVPFGLRDRESISFPVRELLETNAIRYQQALIQRLDLTERHVHTDRGVLHYDILVIATGARPHYEAVPGLGPWHGHTQSIFSWEEAEKARVAFDGLVREPGPVVIGAVPGSPGFGPACEFLLNMAHQLRKHGLEKKAPLTYVTPEPYLGHLGIGGVGTSRRKIEELFHRAGVAAITDAAIQQVTPGEVHLSDGRRLPFRFAMLTPALLGIDPVRQCGAITNPAGFVKINDSYQTDACPEVFAAGVAVALATPEETPVPCGVPKTGYLSEEMGRVVAHNIAARIAGEPMLKLPPASIDARWILDAGSTGVIMTADRFLEPREQTWLLPGPEAHWAKVTFEKYFLARLKSRRV